MDVLTQRRVLATVAQLREFLDHLGAATLAEHGAPPLEALLEAVAALAIQQPTDRGQMPTGMPEVQDVPDLLPALGQVCHAVPDPRSAIGYDHQGQRGKLCAAALHLHLDAGEELVGVLDAGDTARVRQAHLVVVVLIVVFICGGGLIFAGRFIGIVPLLHSGHGSYLRVSVLTLVTLVLWIICVLTHASRHLRGIDAHRHRGGDLLLHRHPLVLLQVFLDLLLTLLFQVSVHRARHLVGFAHRDSLAPVGAEHFVEVIQTLLVRLAPAEAGHEVLTPRHISPLEAELLVQRRPAGAAALDTGIAHAHVGHPSVQPVDRLRSLADTAVRHSVLGGPRAPIAVTKLLAPALHGCASELHQAFQHAELSGEHIPWAARRTQVDPELALAMPEQLGYQVLTHHHCPSQNCLMLTASRQSLGGLLLSGRHRMGMHPCCGAASEATQRRHQSS